MPIEGGKVIPIRSRNFLTEQIVELAFAYWRETFGLQNGSPKEYLLRAQREVGTRVKHGRRSGAALYLVRRRR